MNKKLKALLGEKEDLLSQMRALTNKAQAEKRDLSEDEETQFSDLEARVKAINKKIEREKLLIDEERSMAANADRVPDADDEDDSSTSETRHRRQRQTPEQKAKKRYSLVRALRAQMTNKPLDGVEGEMQQEAEKEQREGGISGSPNAVKVPAMFMQRPEQRATMAATGSTTGQNTVATELRDMIGYLYPNLRVEELGATMLTGLSGNIAFPRQDSATAASWAAENGAAPETNPTIGQVVLAPKRLTAFTPISGQLLLQSSEAIDLMVRRDLQTAIAVAVDAAAINGTGSNTPTGILNTSGITTVALGTNGAAPTRTKLLELIGGLEDNNADMGSLGFLTTPGVRRKLMDTLLDSGSGRFVWSEETPNELMGYRALTSNQVPSTLDKGTTTGTLHAIIYANWAEWVIAQWGGVEIIVDQYTGAKNNIVNLVVHSWWDMMARHAKSFAAIKDASIA